jgi:hypothetical protein
MKQIYGLILLTLATFNTPLQAQTPCETVTVEVVPMNPPTGNDFGVRVTLAQAYSQDVTVEGKIFSEGGRFIDIWTLTITAGNLTAQTPLDYYQPDPPQSASATIMSVTPCPSSSEVSVNGNRLKFATIGSYEQYADNELDRSNLTILATQSGSITTLEELNNEQDTLYPEFLKQVLNQDFIMEVSGFLIKIDLQNERVLVIESWRSNAYLSLVNNNLSAQGIMNFDTDVSNGIEILQAIENGTLQVSNYQSAIERTTASIKVITPTTEFLTGTESLNSKRAQIAGPSANYVDSKQQFMQAQFSCAHAGREKDPQKRRWDTDPDPHGCAGQYIYVVDNKLVYQKVVIYFSIQAKTKSEQGCNYSNFNGSGYNASLKLECSARFRKRCNPEQTPSRIDYGSSSVLNWRPYEGSRSLSKYDATATFSIRHLGSSGQFISTTTHHIMWGY